MLRVILSLKLSQYLFSISSCLFFYDDDDDDDDDSDDDDDDDDYLFVYFSISVFVSSWRADETSSREMFDNISQSLDEMRQLIESCDAAKL